MYLIYISAKLTKPPERGGGRGGWRLVFADKCIQGPCFMDNEGSA
jgi:hypothetical protein